MFPIQHWGHARINKLRETVRSFKGDAATPRMFAPFLSAHPRGQSARRMHAEPRPHLNPVTSRRTPVEVVKTSHVMQWCLFGNGMF